MGLSPRQEGAVYQATISRAQPSCILFLIDQSDAGSGVVDGSFGKSRAESAAHLLNELLRELVIGCVKDIQEGPRHYFDVGVVAYGGAVGSGFGGTLAGRDLVSVVDVANQPLRVEARNEGGRNVQFPVWIDPVAKNGAPICAALSKSEAILSEWSAAHQSSRPPTVVNIGGEQATDGDPIVQSRRLQEVHTNDGSTLVFNVALPLREGRAKMFPSRPGDLSRECRMQFEMSSVLPAHMRRAAARFGLSTDERSRCFACAGGGLVDTALLGRLLFGWIGAAPLEL
jgi:hypothetical protein